MKAIDNKFLVMRPGVIMTPIVEPVAVYLDQVFQAAGFHAFISRVLTDAHGQLKIIQNYIKLKGLDKKYPEAMICTDPLEKVGNQYVWQMAWSNLLKIGIIINPALAATCLMDYYGPTGKGPNKIGTVISQTPHVKGTCMDIGGKTGIDPTINDELAILMPAFKKGVPGLINILPEHNNNAIHLDCKKI